ncbi:MAG TPA: hypothetical protein VN426_07270 [Syntrophomonadaceae bacterium]|nr:hypothetical protein [Syntrophomonadaceae bacterium]
MTPSEVIESIRVMFKKVGNPANIPMLQGDLFKAELFKDGIKVEEEGDEGFLPWSAFTETVSLLVGDRGSLLREDVINNKPGDSGLYITSIGGGIAHIVYGGKLGYATYKKIAPIVAILIWADICRYEEGYLLVK